MNDFLLTLPSIYSVTHHVDSNLPLTSKREFSFDLARQGLVRPKRNFCFEVNGRLESA